MDDEPIELRLLREKLAAKQAAAERRAAEKAEEAARKDRYIEAMRLQAQAKLAAAEASKVRTQQAALNKRSAKDKVDDELYRKTQEHLKRVADGEITPEEILARNAALAAEQLRRRKEAQEKKHAEWLAAQTPEDIERARRREEGNP